MNILHLDSSILGDASVSRALSQAIVDRLLALDPGAHVVRHDLVADPIAHLSGRYLAGQSDEVKHDQALQEDLALGARALDEFLAADTVVIGVAFYNFTVASQLKAWVDRVLVAGRTFRYAENGPEGLAGGKRVILAIAQGGFYGPGTGRSDAEHAESYLRTVFGFMGITDVEAFVADGIATGPDRRAAAVEEARAAIAALPVAA